jgi:hypothetical protein
MSSRRKELYCGDTLNTLGLKDHKFYRSQAYNWYKALPPTEKETSQVWSSGIALASSMPKVTDLKEPFLWCVEKFDTERRIIQV